MKIFKIIGLLLLGFQLPTMAADPTWWISRNVKTATQTSNKSVATIGQAKHMTAMALQELRIWLDPSTYQSLLTSVEAIVDLAPPVTAEDFEQQRTALLVGQLKAISDPFYRHLNGVAPLWLAQQRAFNGTQDLATPSQIFPWTLNLADDANKAIATIGQLKSVFALRYEADTDGNALPDFWEYRFTGQLGNTSTFDSDGDGMSNLRESQVGSDPLSSDSDQDGMPDRWEVFYSLGPCDPSDALVDIDADGLLNLEEFLGGTNPRVSNARPTGVSFESFEYDKADRLNNVVSPSPVTLGLDNEGNLLNVN